MGTQVLKRVCWSLLQVESEARAASERDFLEMSTAGKTRVLYLEQWKAGASARLLRLQQRLDVSVPEQVNICCLLRDGTALMLEESAMGT